MPEPNFPEVPLVHLSFDLRERTLLDPPSDHAQVAQCNFQHADGTLTSFDPEQLPKFLKTLLGETVVTQAETITKQTDLIASHEAELKAKDANAQVLLERLDETAGKLAAAEAALTVPVELIQALGLLPDPKPPADEPAPGDHAAEGGDPASTGETPVSPPPTDEELFNVAAAAPPPPSPEPDIKPAKRRKAPAK